MNNSHYFKTAKKTLLGIGLSCLASSVNTAPNSEQFTAAPPFVATSVGKPNVVIALDISGSMKAVAYRDTAAGNWSKNDTIHDDFNPSTRYFGYFDSDSKYRYDTSTGKRFFVVDDAGDWDGNFLNWLSMRRMDVVRKVLVGGKVRDRSGETIDGETWWVIEGQNEPADRTFRKRYALSSAVSPFEDGAVIEIADGAFRTSTGNSSRQAILSTSVEVGELSVDRNIADDEDLDVDSDWHEIPMLNTYTNPIIVASSLSFNGSDPCHVRVRKNPLTGKWEVRLEEWDYRDVNHTTEQVSYIIAEATDPASSSSVNIIEVGGSQYEIRANYRTVSSSGSTTETQNYTDNGYKPIVLAGVASMNNARPVVVRLDDVQNSNFEVTLQNEEDFSGGHPSSERVNWVAIQEVSGTSDISGVGLEAGRTGTSVNENFSTVNFSGSGSAFTGTPILSVAQQSMNGSDTAYARYKSVSKSSFKVKIEEEKSKDNEVDHLNEKIGYFAVDAISGYQIKIGVNTEPKGVIQQNSGSMRFGVAVYNYDHEKDPTSIYNGNTVHGGTFRACYPDISKDVSSRSNFDICYDTHVKSPLSNIVNVIEDHPLIWGTTPIAETLYDIKGYFGQANHARNGHTQWYDNGTEGISGASPFDGQPKDRNSYEVNNDWDPYYYEEYGSVLPCAKSFVLHFNDGAPFKDFDGSGHPTLTNDGVGNFSAQEKLDDLALMLRKQDCRTDSGMDGHQEIISYYVYAALGENESNNDDTRRMREAAANGAFVDSDEDLEPDPAHPSNFKTYMDSTTCTPNEWDEDGDCNPDAFYFANDGERLVEELNAAFEDIVTRAATGGASSVIAASRSGEGSVVNAIFRPFVSSGEDEVTWIGDVHALMIDDAGNIRQDDGDQTLESPTQDPYIDMCSNDAEDLVRAKLSNSLSEKPTAAQFAECSASVFTLDLFDIEYLWSGANWLSSLTDAQAVNQRSYSSTTKGRYILTGIDTNIDDSITNSEVLPFVTSSFPESLAGLIQTDLDVAHDVVNWVRGMDTEGLRSRQLDGKTMRLGDVIYSTPTIVGRPTENLDYLYESTSYRAFFNRYRYRRQVIYAGGNDGMLHAFNGGWYNADTKLFQNSHGSSPGSTTNYDLGAELWAYAPYHSLAHLEYLTRQGYGATSADHLYFVDLKPRVFDAKIFADDTDHPGGWGTVLVVGMRLGGGQTLVDADLDSSNYDPRVLQSSILIFDVTNPDNPPRLLIEYSDQENLGFTTSVPAPITVGTDNEGNGEWYLMVGSGPDTSPEGFAEVKSTTQSKIHLLDLKAIVSGVGSVLKTSFGTDGILSFGDPNSFVSDLVSVDFNLDKFTTDGIYFGTVSGDESAWGGKLYKIATQDTNDGALKAVNTWTPQELLNPNRPITSPITLASDKYFNHWIYFGTGRYFTSTDNLDTAVNYYYGVKEPRDTSGAFTHGTINSSKVLDISSINVESGTAKLDPIPSLSPALPENATVFDLEDRMRQFNTTANFLAGWRRTFTAGERNFGSATALAGTVSYTTFSPLVDECSIDGSAYLYVVNSLTGTATEKPIITQSSSDTVNQYVIDIGSSPATSPSLHRGEGYTTDKKTTAIIQTANGNIISIEQNNQEKVRNGEASWRQLR